MIRIFVILFFACSWPAYCQRNDTESNRELFWSAETNGYSVGIGIYRDYNHFVVFGRIHRPAGTNWLFARTNMLSGPNFLMPTNWLPGILELRDPKGNIVRSGRSDFLSTNAYPEVLHWKVMKFDSKRSGPVPGDASLFVFNREAVEDRYGFFQLDDFFKYEQTGEYHLIIYPMLYKLTQSNGDLYQRMDLPPVTVPFEVR